MSEEAKNHMPFGKINYTIMIVGLVTLIIGFVLMASDTETYGLGSLGWVVGPIVVLLGFIIELAAVLIKPKDEA